MANCGSCGSFIVMGGVRTGQGLYCNEHCVQQAQQANVISQLPPDQVARQVNEVWQSRCPLCKGPGPIDVYKVHKVFSLFLFTRWTSGHVVACRSCGLSRQFWAQVFSLLFGWWGFPWGLIITPLQLLRNFEAGKQAPKPGQPSENLRQVVMVDMANQIAAGTEPEAQTAPRRPRDPSEPLQEGDRVRVAVGDKSEEATILAIRDIHARCTFADGRRAWVPLASLTFISQGAAADTPLQEGSAPKAVPAATAAARLTTEEAKADVPFTGRQLAIFYTVFFAVVLLKPFIPFGILYWLPLIAYYQWRKSRPLRAKKWLPHALVICGLGVVNFVFPLYVIRIALARMILK